MKRLVWLAVFSLISILFVVPNDSAAVNPQKTPVEARKARAQAALRQNAPPPPAVLESPPLPQRVLDGKLAARPLQSMLRSALPPSIDYSNYVTFTRTQGQFGGCFIYAALYVIDILKEKEHPYTPDLSYRFAEYYYNDQNVDQKKVHVDYGSCPEAILHTDYDALVWVNDHFDDSQCPQPTPQIAAEAKLYRIADTSEYITPTAGTLKTLLVEKGPLWGMGTISGVGHCIAIVGYDDNQNAFKFINSWGDQWNGDGYGLIPYTQVGQMLSAVTYFTNRPSERAGTPEAYSARIRIRHENSRNELTVSVGVEGQTPLVIWDRPNESPLVDGSRDLNIDVPLPPYARSHWPPSQTNLWYVQVMDGNTNEKSAQIEEVTLARLMKKPNGKYMTEVRRPHMRTFSIPDGGRRKIYVGAQSPKRELMITPGQTNISPGGSLAISGKLSVTSYDTDAPLDVHPLAHKQIKINSVGTASDSVEQSVWTQVGTVATDANGEFSFMVTPTVTASGATTTYIAVYTEPDDGQILAWSNLCKVMIGVKKISPAIKDRIIKK